MANQHQPRRTKQRLARLLRIFVRVKTAPENATVLALCEECGISRRTLFRDLKLLREVGVRITYDDRTGSFRIDSIDLDKTEQKSA